MALSRTQSIAVDADNGSLSSCTAGDLIVVYAYRGTDATLTATLPTGFTNIQNAVGTLQTFRIGYKVAAGGETSTGTWTNATQVLCHVFRGARGFPAGFGKANNSGSSATITYSAFTLGVTNGTSWIAAFAGARSATAGMNGTPTNLTNRANVVTANVLDTGAGKTSWSSTTLSVTGNGRWFSYTLEIQEMPIMTADQGSYALTGEVTGLLIGKKVAPSQGSYSLSGQAVSLKSGKLITITQGSYVLTGVGVTLVVGRGILTVNQGSYNLTGEDVALRISRGILSITQGSYTLTGEATSLLLERKIELIQGSYSLSGQAVSLIFTPSGAFSILIDSGSYALTGEAVTLERGRKMSLTQGAYTLLGESINLPRGLALAVSQGSYILVGNDVTLARFKTIALEPGEYELTGMDVGMIYDRVMPVDSGEYDLTGSDLGTLWGHVIFCDTGYYVLTGFGLRHKITGETFIIYVKFPGPIEAVMPVTFDPPRIEMVVPDLPITAAGYVIGVKIYGHAAG